MNKIKFIILLILSNSCLTSGENGINVEIENNSNLPVYGVQFNTTEELISVNFEKIKSKESVSDFLPMKNNKSDGAYVLNFTRANGEKEQIVAGYYTNGSSINKNVRFIIERKTVLITFDGNID